jgi:hypothetical protein
MKMNDLTYLDLRLACMPHIPATNTERTRWDMFWKTGFDVNRLYRDERLNDSHIDTALKKIIREVNGT